MPFDGRTTATIQIGGRTIVLRGRLGGQLSKSIELSYHAQTLDEAIDLGEIGRAVTDLMTMLSKSNFENDFKPLLAPAYAVLNAIPGISDPNSSVTPFLRKLHEIMKLIAEAGDLVDLANQTIHIYLTDIVLKADLTNPSSSLPPGEITIGLAFQFTDVKVLNIQLLSAGILFTTKIVS